jgi:hypothetical protein
MIGTREKSKKILPPASKKTKKQKKKTFITPLPLPSW